MKKLLIALGALVVLLLVGYFVVTSSGFAKSVVLPKVGAALNANVEAESISLSPFSSVEIRKLKVTPQGRETLATVDLARVRYSSLFAILGGKLAIDEILVSDSVVTVVQRADGTSNLDPILKKLAEPAPAGTSPSASSQAPQVDLRSFQVSNARVSYVAEGPGGTSTRMEIDGASFSLRDVKNGGTGSAETSASVKFSKGLATSPADAIDAKVSGRFGLTLTADLAPSSVSGKADLTAGAARGSFKDFDGFGAVLTAELTPAELKNLALQFQRKGASFGSVSASGPLDLAKKEGRLRVDVEAIDRNVLNLVGAAMNLDFATTRFDSTNAVQLSEGGQRVAIAGVVSGRQVSVKQGDLTMPALDLRKAYDLVIDLAKQSATVNAYQLSAQQGGREIIEGSITRPINLSWAANAGSAPDASLRVAIKDLRIADWSALLGTSVRGSLTAQSELGVRNGGKDLIFEARAGLRDLNGSFGSNTVSSLGFDASLSGTFASFADPAGRRLTANGAITNLTGRAAVVEFDRYGVATKLDVKLPAGSVAVNELQMGLSQAGVPGGTVGITGQWQTERGTGEWTVSAKGVNEVGLRPFAKAGLGTKELRSVLVSSETRLGMPNPGEGTIVMSADVTNLVVVEAGAKAPSMPLAAGLKVDASGANNHYKIRQGQLKLTPTARADNQLNLSGDLDLSKTNAISGALKLAAESVDVTPFYDALTGGAATDSAESTPPAPAPASTGPSKEPEAIALPVELLTFDTRIGKFFLREVVAESVVAALKIQGSKVELRPMEAKLNGAPVKAGLALNLGVPGYQYDLQLSASNVPVQPLANSFVPLLKGRIEGTVLAGMDVKGAGTTGTSLQKNLAGQANLSVTNANLKLSESGKQKGFLSVLAGLLSSALNLRELKDQPIMEVIAVAKMGEGRIDLTEALARSASFEASAAGGIPIANELMQSKLDFPVDISLKRELAISSRLANADAPTNKPYVLLPRIASLKGTVGAPAPEIDKIKVGLLLAKGIGGMVGGQAGSAISQVTDLVTGVTKGDSNAVGNLIQGVGGLLGGGNKSSNPTPAPATTTTPAPAKAPGTGTGTAPANTAAPVKPGGATPEVPATTATPKAQPAAPPAAAPATKAPTSPSPKPMSTVPAKATNGTPSAATIPSTNAVGTKGTNAAPGKATNATPTRASSAATNAPPVNPPQGVLPNTPPAPQKKS
ncbi:MAG: AsmA family protein [Verrucomicrobiales bacterium]|nr:AsmA family protein [Verrucomicrobiales bacterium]